MTNHIKRHNKMIFTKKKKTFLFALNVLGIIITSQMFAQSGNVLSLNGVGQYMTVLHNTTFDVTPTTSRTITMWFKTTLASGSSRLIAKRSATFGVNQTTGGVGGTGYEMFIGNSSGYKIGPNARSTTNTNLGGGFNNLVINDGNWHHVAWVLSNNGSWSSTLYLDGANMTTFTNASTQDISNLVNLVIGGASDFSNLFTGSIDDVRIYNYDMSGPDVTTDKNTAIVNNTTTGLVAGWDFETITSGTTVADVSGNNNPGTLVGSPTIVNIGSTNMQITATSLVQTELPVGMGDVDQRIIAVKATTTGTVNPLTLSALNFAMNGSTNVVDVSNIKVYYTGASSRFNTNSLFATVAPASGTLVANGSQTLSLGDNYFFIAYDVSASATEGNLLDATCESIVANAITYTLSSNTISGSRTVLLENTLLFTPGDAGSSNYRIPAIVTADDGSLVTATDKRWNGPGDLSAKIDPVIRRSTDNGKTWSAPIVIANFGASTGAGDPALVLDKTNGDLLCFLAANMGFFPSTNSNPIKLLVVRSTDNGVTWGTPVDITSQIYGPNPGWKGIFVASGQALQLRNGTIVAGIAVRENVSGIEHINNYMISSTDHGITWTASTGRAELDGDESKIVELNNGNLMMSIRNSGTRRFNISTNQGLTWGTAYNQAAITDPNCNGDFIRYTSVLDGYDKNRLLHSIPFASSRQNVSVLLSIDEGATWPVKKTIFPGASAYSSLTILPDGSIGIYYENGEYGDVYAMYFVRFSLNWLTNGADTYTGIATSINNKTELKSTFALYPNPAKESFTIELQKYKNYQLKVNNVLGQTVYEVKLTNSNTMVDVSEFGTGLYLVHLVDTSSNTEEIKKVVIE
jgi:hypothetical protein